MTDTEMADKSAAEGKCAPFLRNLCADAGYFPSLRLLLLKARIHG